MLTFYFAQLRPLGIGLLVDKLIEGLHIKDLLGGLGLRDGLSALFGKK